METEYSFVDTFYVSVDFYALQLEMAIGRFLALRAYNSTAIVLNHDFAWRNGLFAEAFDLSILFLLYILWRNCLEFCNTNYYMEFRKEWPSKLRRLWLEL